MAVVRAAPRRVLLSAWLVSLYSVLAAGDDPAASLLSQVGTNASASNAQALQAGIFLGTLSEGQTLPQDTPLFSTDMAVQLIMQSDGNVVLYNTTKVAAVGYNGASAVWQSATYTSSPQAPYSLVMQSDCNLVAYSGLALTEGYSQATAVYYSGTYSYAAESPCTLHVSSVNGGSIYIQVDTGSIVYQEPAPAVAVPPGSLYNFNGITFSTCQNTGQTGPQLSQCTFNYAQYGAWTANSAFFNVQNGIQVWTVPSNGTYSFTVSGATGGSVYLGTSNTQPSDLGGQPAVVSGTVALTVGRSIYLVVGQTAGINPDGNHNGGFGGGGGGTFVFLGDLSTPLLVAGGGGGGGEGLGGNATAANSTAAPMGGLGGPNYQPQGQTGATGQSSPGSSGLPGLGGNGGYASGTSLRPMSVYYTSSGGGGGGGSLGNSASTYIGGLGGTGSAGNPPYGPAPISGAAGGFGGGGGSGAAPGEAQGNSATAGFSGGGGGGFSGGNGGGTPNANTTALCGVIIGFPMNQNIYCNAPAASAPAAGGTSFASGMAGSVAFQLGPQEFPFTPDPNGGFFFNQAQNGYVQVARVS